MELYPKFLIEYYHLQIIEFQDKFQRAKTDKEEEAIHALRVSLKKIRAFFRLMEHLNPEFPQKENFKPFRKVFKEAGALRDIQVQIHLMSAFDKQSDRKFKSYLSDLETLAKIRFGKRVVLDLRELSGVNPEIESFMGGGENDGLADRVIGFVVDRIEATTSQFHNGTGVDRMHRSRILLKDVYFVLQMLSHLKVKPKPFNILLNKVDQLQSTFGIWHDWEVALHHYGDYLAIRDNY